MSEKKRKEAIQILEDAWEDFKGYFDDKCRHYSREMKTKEAKKSYWICWSEFDLLTQLARFYYKRLEENRLDNVEMHVNVRLSPTNFPKGYYEFHDNLKEVKEKLNRTPKPDLIIVFEDSPGPLILCAEVKYLRYSVERWKRTSISDLEKDKDTLLALKDNKICSYLAYILIDDHYIHNDETKAKEIEEKLNEYNQKYDIKKLYHTSKAKIPLS